jgi:dihydroorotate dehydrogenase
VQVGTALFVEPDAPVRIVAGLQEYMKTKRLAHINDIIGKVRKYT